MTPTTETLKAIAMLRESFPMGSEQWWDCVRWHQAAMQAEREQRAQKALMSTGFKSPWNRHVEAQADGKHKETRFSPDGFQMITECETCQLCWIHTPTMEYPVTVRRYPYMAATGGLTTNKQQTEEL